MGNAKDKMTKEERDQRQKIDALQKKTNLHKVDATVLHQVFNETSGGKPLNKVQFNEALHQLEKHGLNDIKNTAISDALFSHFDSDGNGTLELQEFLSGLTLLCKGSIDDKVALTFQLYDTDNSKSIDRKEMSFMLSKSLESAFSMAGVGMQDGNKEDMKTMMQELTTMMINIAVDAAFAQCDTNHDGKLSLE